ncbi:BRCA1-associated protein 2-domain-containing protein [Gigaspora rosea]|uniref:BRCA1-associated protein 2-domain-containing protein n=1 Tax=Gigaspora rosea TaxID=44941 RepID=A0A397TXN2_9GLOM|nr:BRCA1-associated protein 2-domain-containing protein [Gigaspora rosea]CAG8579592.1 16234_t:CDS:2 [Gigaspora rosea]
MYFYHLKFELYIPARNNLQDNYPKKFINEVSPDLFYVPKDIFAPLPTHSQLNNEPQSSLQPNNSKAKGLSKVKSRSLDLSKPSSSQVPSIPPTPISKDNSSSNISSSPSSWTFVGRRKSIASIASTSTIPSTITTIKPNLDKTHDFRFGKIEIEWFDNSEIIDIENMGENMSENQKIKSSSDKAVIPAGEFVPLKSGKTNLSYGVLHLYRDPSEICSSKNDQGFIRVEKNNKNKSDKQINSESIQNSSDKQEDFPNIQNNEETILAVLAVPSFMSASDFLAFVAPVQRFVSHFRFIRDSAPNKFMVLMKFRHARAAWDFYRQFNGRPFSSMEPEICHVAYIKSIEFKSTSIPPDAFPFLYDPFIPSTQNDTTTNNDQTQQSSESSEPSALYELPTCPVCLERMDASVTGLLTILCQHTFHCDCLSKWGDSSCPVCRYSRQGYVLDSSLGQNECGVCGVNESLWICLICGNIGCGRYQEAHAYCHYKETSHLYALELETQRVWDYAGDGYVHRLIQNKSDGKLVELPSPDSPLQMQQQREAIDQDKLDAIGQEYSYLLSTQLSSQRVYYEEKLESITLQLSKLTNQVQNLENEISTLNQDKDKYKKENELLEKEKIPSLIKEKKAIEKKMEKFTEKSNKLEKELNGEKELTKSLLMKQEYLQSQLENKDTKIKDLEEQVRDLMFFFSSQEKLKENPELAGGNIVVSENSSNSGGNARKKKGKR